LRLRYFPVGEDGIDATPLTTDSLALFCASSSPLADKKRMTWNERPICHCSL